MKKTTKRLLIFLLCFVMLLTAVAVVVSAKGATESAVQPVSDDLVTPYGTIPDNFKDANKYPFIMFKLRNGKLYTTTANYVYGYESWSAVVTDAKSYALASSETVKFDYEAVILMRRDYETVYGNGASDHYSNYAQNRGTITLDLNGHTLTQGSTTSALFYNVTSKPLGGNVFDSVYTVKNGNIVVKTNSVFRGNMWEPLYYDASGNRISGKAYSKEDCEAANEIKDAYIKDDGKGNYYVYTKDGVKIEEGALYANDNNTKFPIKYPIRRYDVTMADKHFTWNFENVKFSYAVGATATNMLMTYNAPQNILMNPPTATAPFYFNFTSCTFDLTNAPAGKTVTLFNAAPYTEWYLSSTIKVMGCELKATPERLASLKICDINYDSGSSVEFLRDYNSEFFMLDYVGELGAPTDATLVNLKKSVGDKPVDRKLYWQLVNNKYTLIDWLDKSVCSECADSNDDNDEFCDKCGAENIGGTWLLREHAYVYPFVVLKANGDFHGVYTTWGKAMSAALAIDGSTTVVRHDYKLAIGDSTNLKNRVGTFNIDLRGNTITRADFTDAPYLFDNWCDAKTKAGAVKIVLKNGTLNADKWLICLSGNAAMATEKRIDFEFEDVTFKATPKLARTSGWLVSVHNTKYNKRLDSDIAFINCTFDMTELSSSLDMDKTIPFDLDITNQNGEDWIKVNLTFVGGTIKARALTRHGFMQTHSDDKVIVLPNSDGKYLTLELPEGVAPTPPIEVFTNSAGNKMYFHEKSDTSADGDVYLLSACVLEEGAQSHACKGCHFVITDCYDSDSDSICDQCGLVYGYIADKYGIKVSADYADVNEYPFYVLKKTTNANGVVTYEFVSAAKTLYGKNGSLSGIPAAVDISIGTVLNPNNKYEKRIEDNKEVGDYVPEVNGGSLASAIIVFRKDYSVKWNRDAADGEYEDDLAHAQGEIVFDLAGHTFSEASGGSGTFFYDIKKWSDSKDGVYTFPSTFTFENGSVKVYQNAFVRLGTNDEVPSSDWHISDSVLNLNFKDITFGFANGATAENLAFVHKGATNNSTKPEDTAKANVTFTGCTFDLTNAPNHAINIINNDTTGKDVDSDIVVEGCKIVASSMANVTVYKDSGTNGSTTRLERDNFGEGDYLSLVAPKGSYINAKTVIVDTGAVYSFVKTSTDYANDYYTLTPTVTVGYLLKTNVTLHTNFIYNIYVPKKAAIEKILIDGEEMDLTKARVVEDGKYYLFSISIPAGETLNNIAVRVVFESGSTSVELNWTLNIYDYANTIISGKYSNESKTLMKDLLIYAYTAHKYFAPMAGETLKENVEEKLAEIENIIESHYRRLPTGEVKNASSDYFTSVALSTGDVPGFRFYVKNGKDANNFAFTAGNTDCNKTVSKDGTYIDVTLPAHAMLSDITVKYGEEDAGAYNIFAYHKYVKDDRTLDNYFKLVAVVEGLMKYAASANEYKAYMVNGEFGSMTIVGPETIYANYPGVDITALFTNGAYYGNVTWTTSHQSVHVEDGKIYAVGQFAANQTVTVTATTEHHTATKNINVVTYTGNDKHSILGVELYTHSMNFGGKYITDEQGNALSNHYAVTGKLDISKLNLNNEPHIQFKLGNKLRFLLADNTKNGIFAAGYENPEKGGNTDGNGHLPEKYDANNGLMLDWAVVVEDTKAYWYLNGELVQTLEDKTGDEYSFAYFHIGALYMNVVFSDIKVVKLDNKSGAYMGNYNVSGADVTNKGVYLKDVSGNDLNGDFFASGEIDILRINKNDDPHVQFRFVDGYRFLLWDNDIDGKFVGGWQDASGHYSENSTKINMEEKYESKNGMLSVKWAVIVKDNIAYWYLNDEFVVAIAEGNELFEYFNIGAGKNDALLSNVTVIAEKDNADAYNTVLSEYEGKVGYGEMTLTAPNNIYSQLAGEDLTVSFSNSKYAGNATYTTDHDQVKVENGKIYATGYFENPVNVTVTAKAGFITATAVVNVSNSAGVDVSKKVQYYEANIIKQENKGGIIFVGDSYFDGAEAIPPFWSDFYQDYAGEKAFLMGMSKSQISDLEIASERIVYPMEPKEIVVHIGFNDVHSGNLPVEELIARMKALFTEYHTKLPDAKVYFCGVEPKKTGYSASSDFYYSSTVKAPAVTAAMQQFAAENSDWFKYVDTVSIFTQNAGQENQSVNQNLYLPTDLSHPTLPAYDLIRFAIDEARGITHEDVVKINELGSGTHVNDNGKTFENIVPGVGDYAISGKLVVTAISSYNGHIHFRFSDSKGTNTDCRFILWDKNHDGAFGVGRIGGDSQNAENETDSTPGAVILDAKMGLVLNWAVVVNGGKAYWYIDGKLMQEMDTPDLQYFNIGGEGVIATLYDINLSVKADDNNAYKYVTNHYKYGANDSISSTGVYVKDNNGNDLTGNYAVKGKIEIFRTNLDPATSNDYPHIQFRFNTSRFRFFMSDSDRNNTLVVTTDGADKTKTWDATKGLVFEWAIIVKDGVAYLYIDGEFITSIDKAFATNNKVTFGFNFLNIGAIAMDMLVSDVEVIKLDDSTSQSQHYVGNYDGSATEGDIVTTGMTITDSAKENLVDNYVVKGKLDVLRLNTAHTYEPQIQFRFVKDYRFLLADDDKDGIMNLRFYQNSSVYTSQTAERWDATKGISIEWTVIVKNRIAYLYFDDEFIGTVDTSTAEGLYFNVGALRADVLFYNIELITLADNAAAYNEAVAEYMN